MIYSKCTKEIIEEKLKEFKDVERYQISAKDGDGVEEMFLSLIDLVNHRINNMKIIDEIAEISQNKEKDDRLECVDTGKIVLKYENTTVTLCNTQ